jgi:hypothetical protein
MFWVAPATLVFDRVHQLSGEIVQASELEIADLHRMPPPDAHPDPLWHIEGQAFDLRFRAAGFVQYFRRPPRLVERQTLTLAERGGISVAEEAFA